jgi:Chaperone of endosialidase
VANGPAQIGVYAGNQNTLATTTGWALYANNYAGGLTAWQNVSDRRLKKDIVTINGALDLVKRLRGVNYVFDKEKYPDINLPDGMQWGFVAQELEEVMPNVVRESVIPGGGNKKATPGTKDETNFYKFKTVSYSTVIPVLVEAIKEQQKQIEELQKQLDLLKK